MTAAIIAIIAIGTIAAGAIMIATTAIAIGMTAIAAKRRIGARP
jgi:hypothetical protein